MNHPLQRFMFFALIFGAFCRGMGILMSQMPLSTEEQWVVSFDITLSQQLLNMSITLAIFFLIFELGLQIQSQKVKNKNKP